MTIKGSAILIVLVVSLASCSNRQTGEVSVKEDLIAKQLLQEAKIAVSPGNGFGEAGEGYVRIALIENENRIRQAARNIKKYLKCLEGSKV